MIFFSKEKIIIIDQIRGGKNNKDYIWTLIVILFASLLDIFHFDKIKIYPFITNFYAY